MICTSLLPPPEFDIFETFAFLQEAFFVIYVNDSSFTHLHIWCNLLFSCKIAIIYFHGAFLSRFKM